MQNHFEESSLWYVSALKYQILIRKIQWPLAKRNTMKDIFFCTFLLEVVCFAAFFFPQKIGGITFLPLSGPLRFWKVAYTRLLTTIFIFLTLRKVSMHFPGCLLELSEVFQHFADAVVTTFQTGIEGLLRSCFVSSWHQLRSWMGWHRLLHSTSEPS